MLARANQRQALTGRAHSVTVRLLGAKLLAEGWQPVDTSSPGVAQMTNHNSDGCKLRCLAALVEISG